jgi:hypothetical protein
VIVLLIGALIYAFVQPAFGLWPLAGV